MMWWQMPSEACPQNIFLCLSRYANWHHVTTQREAPHYCPIKFSPTSALPHYHRAASLIWVQLTSQPALSSLLVANQYFTMSQCSSVSIIYVPILMLSCIAYLGLVSCPVTCKYTCLTHLLSTYLCCYVHSPWCSETYSWFILQKGWHAVDSTTSFVSSTCAQCFNSSLQKFASHPIVLLLLCQMTQIHLPFQCQWDTPYQKCSP